jgi:streptomycin 6-kinase
MISTNFEQKIITTLGQEGIRWLQRVPQLLSILSDRYSLTNLQNLPSNSLNLVVAAEQATAAVILKLSAMPWTLAAEARALKAMAGYGVIRLIDEHEGALLLERPVPGYCLESYYGEQEGKSIAAFCELIKELHQAPLAHRGFVNIADWLAELDGQWDIPQKILYKARALKDDLLATQNSSVLLHGDLHHENIVQRGQEFVAINPKGVVGEALYEAGAFIRNPRALFVGGDVNRVVNNRIQEIATCLGAKPKRLTQWCFVQAVLAWIWALQEKQEVAAYEKIAFIINGQL